jgi:ABC-2 type transport system ATP-binding protein
VNVEEANGKVPPLQAVGLSKTYTRWRWTGRRLRTEALSDLDLTVHPGEVYGIVGPNGSGKSTTLKMAMGLIFPTRGNIRVNGFPAGDFRARKHLGFLPENPSLVPHLTPRALLRGAGRTRGLAPRAARQEADRLLGALGLQEAANRPIQEHSKGMAQRAAIGFALIGEPRFLVLDEPLTGLDPLWRHRVNQLLQAFREEGGTLLFSSHILADVERLADRVGIFHRGHLLREARPADLLAERTEGFLIRFRGGDPPSAWQTTAEGPNIWRLEVATDELWPSLDGLKQAGMKLVEVRPQGAGLEGTFLQATGESHS